MHASERKFLLFLGDAAGAFVAAFIALAVWAARAQAQAAPITQSSKAFWFSILVFTWLSLSIGQYNVRVATSRKATARGFLRVAAFALICYLVLFFFAPPGLLPRLVVLCYVAVALVGCLGWRLVYIKLFVSPRFSRNLLLLDTGWGVRLLAAALGELRHHYRIVGIATTKGTAEDTDIAGFPVLGTQEELLALAEKHGASEIVLPATGEISGRTFRTLVDAMAKGISVVRLASLYEEVTGRVPIGHLDVDWMVGSFLEPARRPSMSGTIAKRMLDFLGSFLGLCCALPLAPFIAAVIWLEDRGPIFYSQPRLGLNDIPFRIWKFRTMVLDAEAAGQPQWTSRNDRRITRVGWFLRRTRLDELPQFWNILRGDMSLVGPRPERPEFIATLETRIPFYRARLVVKPGLTGWAQVSYRYAATEEDTATKLEYDLYYIKHQSMWFDCQILARTIEVMLTFKGR